MKGRKPTPIEQRIRNGNPQRRPLPAPVILGGRAVPADLAEPPEWLPSDGKAFWKRDIAKLVEAGVVDRVDMAALEILAVSYARWCQAVRVTNERGAYMTGVSGEPKVAPWFLVEERMGQAYDRRAEQFGLNPVSRARLGLVEVSRRSMAVDLEDRLGPVTLTAIDSTAEDA